jgi:hypothetical protein
MLIEKYEKDKDIQKTVELVKNYKYSKKNKMKFQPNKKKTMYGKPIQNMGPFNEIDRGYGFRYGNYKIEKIKRQIKKEFESTNGSSFADKPEGQAGTVRLTNG